jgi:hypothetical protein
MILFTGDRQSKADAHGPEAALLMHCPMAGNGGDRLREAVFCHGPRDL